MRASLCYELISSAVRNKRERGRGGTSKRYVGEAHSVLTTEILLPQRLSCYWARTVSLRMLADLRLPTAQQRTIGQNLPLGLYMYTELHSKLSTDLPVSWTWCSPADAGCTRRCSDCPRAPVPPAHKWSSWSRLAGSTWGSWTRRCSCNRKSWHQLAATASRKGLTWTLSNPASCPLSVSVQSCAFHYITPICVHTTPRSLHSNIS
jgi:hypothetical protein